MSRAHIFFDTPNTYLESDISEVAIILGVSDDGPVNKPIRVKSYTEYARVFGSVSTMENAYLSMLNRDNIEIYIMRINGSCASAQIPYAGGKSFTITSYKAGSRYNNRLSVAVGTKGTAPNQYLALTLSDSQYVNRAGTHEIISYNLTRYNNVSKLCEVINKDQMYGVHGFTALDTEMITGVASDITVGNYPLLGGYDYEYTDSSESAVLFTNYITSISLDEGYGLSLNFYQNIDPTSVDVSMASYIPKNPEHETSVVSMAVPDEFQNIIAIGLASTPETGPCDGDVICITDGLQSSAGDRLPNYRFEFVQADPEVAGEWHECRSLKKLLLSAYEDHLYNSGVKTLVLTGVNYGNSVDYAYDLAYFCYRMNKVGYPLIGILSSYPKGDQTLSSYIDQLTSTRLLDNFMIGDEDIGAYLCLTAGEVYLTYNEIVRQITTEGLLGGLLTSIADNRNATNKLMSSDVTLVYDFKAFSIREERYLDIFSDQHFNVPYLSVGRGICLYNAVTAADTGFIKTKNTRIGQAIIARIKVAIEPYIGQPITSISSTRLSNTVTQVLDDMVGESFMKSYSFSIEKSGLYDLLIDIDFTPIGDIDQLSVCIVV